MSELLQSHNKMEEELLLMDEQIKWFLEMQTTPVEDSVKIVEFSTTKNLEYDINSVGKAVAVWEDWLQFWKKFYCE